MYAHVASSLIRPFNKHIFFYYFIVINIIEEVVFNDVTQKKNKLCYKKEIPRLLTKTLHWQFLVYFMWTSPLFQALWVKKDDRQLEVVTIRSGDSGSYSAHF